MKVKCDECGKKINMHRSRQMMERENFFRGK